MSRTRPSRSSAFCGADFVFAGAAASAMGADSRCMEQSRPASQAGPASMPHTTYSLSDFDFALPPELIAQHPAAERSASRLLDGRDATPVDRVFRELPALLNPGDLLVFNDTR